MRIVADLHIHSKYALATSKDTDLDHLAAGARAKGIELLGTGDFTHPKWLGEIRAKLGPDDGEGVYGYQGIHWVLSCEVSTVYRQDGKTRKVHHVLFAPDFDTVSQVNDRLSAHGNLSSDGRPTLTGIDSAELVDELFSVSPDVVVIPAHAWTPWFGVFGSKSGFDSLEECYGDRAKDIFAIESGLSSDPPMNWRVSALDRLAIVSNSDAHSPYPWRLGREANVFELPMLSYTQLFDAVRKKDPSRFLFTVEVDPAYGKYHFTGHKGCGVSLAPEDAKRLKNVCPKCGRKLTVGVLQRVDDLADRPEGYVPEGAIPFKRLLPLYEVIAHSTGISRLYAKSVIELQDRLVGMFGSEFAVLLDAPEEEVTRVAPPKVAKAIVANREGRVKVIPGYDGAYGTPVLTE
ncbi:MAG: DNA helicase UvrD [Nitrososphaerota archaeon]|nr:DNA helicase UvrD [Nitrososphaerota archaeon]